MAQGLGQELGASALLLKRLSTKKINKQERMNYGLVWFKRDLRWQDHAALSQASKNGAVRCIYIVEPNCGFSPRVHFNILILSANHCQSSMPIYAPMVDALKSISVRRATC